MNSLHSLVTTRGFVLAEFVLLCIVLPTFIIFNNLGVFMFTFLWGATLFCWIIFRLHPEKPAPVWNFQAINKKTLPPILLRWLAASLLLIPFTFWYDSERLFYLPLNRPEFLPVLMTAYPILSALPQEFIFCTYFFMRYAGLFPRQNLMILMSAITFAYAHMLYINPVAPTLGFIAGLIFASTYAKHRSLGLVTLEHALYGNTLFIVGLGYYFYSGAITP